MPEKIEQKVLNFINLHNLLPAGGKVLLAVSGGADSVALVQILVGLKSAGRFDNDFHIAHINHQLRGQMSLEDEKFVKILAEKHNLPVTVEQIDVKKYARQNKLSTETAARDLRLEKLATIAQKTGCACIAAAHQKNDEAETVVHRLLRGTGFKGLAAIRPKTVLNGVTFIRPLLCISRKEIEDYLVSQNIGWQTDHTNLDCRFTRNHIRHRLLPMLQKQSCDDLIELLFVLTQKGLALSEKIERLAGAARKECILEQSKHFVTVDTDRFNNYSSLLKVEIIQNALQYCGIGLQKFTNVHYDKIIKFLADSRTGRTALLPNKAIIKKQQKSFYLGHPENRDEKFKPVQLKTPGSVHFADWIIETEVLPADKFNVEKIKSNKDKFIEWFDIELVKPPLIARCRQQGDKFNPFGLGVPKKIGKFITSARLDPRQKNKTFVVCDSEKILWLVPFRRSSEAPLTNTSKSLLQIKIKTTQNKT